MTLVLVLLAIAAVLVILTVLFSSREASPRRRTTRKQG
jgi:preprotein translocase subunit SecG